MQRVNKSPLAAPGSLLLIEKERMFTKTFYGNTVYQWFLAAMMIVGALVVGKVLYWLIGKTIKRLATKTRTRLDDILVDMCEEVINLLHEHVS